MYSTVVTLICNADQPTLTSPAVNKISDLLSIYATGPSNSKVNVHTLSEKIAVDFHFTPTSNSSHSKIIAALHDPCTAINADFALQSLQGRKKKLLIADMDSTIINQECIDELAAEIGKRDEISEITERAMRGELDFEEALETRVATLKGLSETALTAAYQNRITITPGATTLVDTMNANGAMTALVSGGFTFFTERVAQKTGFQRHKANVLKIKNGVLTGTVEKPILGRIAKEKALITLCTEQSIETHEALAVGDGANDLAMIGRAGLGVAFCAKPAVAAAADVAINHRDLTALLYLQGYSESEIIRSPPTTQ